MQQTKKYPLSGGHSQYMSAYQKFHAHSTTPAGLTGILDRLDRPRQTGPGRYIAYCSAHDDRSPSLSIREIDDGRILLHCFAGCSAADVLSAVGLDMRSLFPDGGKQTYRGIPDWKRKRLESLLDRESLIIELARSDLAHGKQLSVSDADRLKQATIRVIQIQEALQHG